MFCLQNLFTLRGLDKHLGFSNGTLERLVPRKKGDLEIYYPS
jgi:hypothetical protein